MTAQKEPIFICGLGRSGTTWLASSLGQYPQLTFIREAWLIRRLSDLVDWYDMLFEEWQTFTPWRKAGIDKPAFVTSLATFYRGLLETAAEGNRFVEKTPEWNLMYFDLLSAMFPNAYFVLIYRDGRNQVASLEAKKIRDKKPFDFEKACSTWAKSMAIIRRTEQHRDSSLRTMFVRYEDMLNDFDGIFGRLCTFVEIEPITPSRYKPNTSFPGAGATHFNARWHSWSPDRRHTFQCLAGEQLTIWGYMNAGEAWSAPTQSPRGDAT